MICKLSVVPLAAVPCNTAGGCGWSGAGRDATGTGTIPRLARTGSEVSGSWTGTDPDRGVYAGTIGRDCGTMLDVVKGWEYAYG